TVDGRLYEGFIGDSDRAALPKVRTAAPDQLSGFASSLHDERLKSLLPLYKARNYPKNLDADERAAWEAFCRHQLIDGGQSSGMAKYFARLQELAADAGDNERRYLLEELQLYGEAIVPSAEDGDENG